MERFPRARSDDNTLEQLLREMLEVLDYLAFRGLCHRDVKPDNILYVPINNHECIFQLADFGFANQKDLAQTYCGSPMFMVPEMYFHTYPQTPKMDVWSLFVTIVSIRRTASFDDKRVRKYTELLDLVRTAATILSPLSHMARQDPALRASAAQMLVQCFQGNGLTTPRGQVGPIPFPGDGPSRAPSPSGTQPKALVKVDAIRKRGDLASPRQLLDCRDKAHPIPAKDRVRKVERKFRGRSHSLLS
jgi:serine/threonine protein kinase